jgi:hypothetical protein
VIRLYSATLFLSAALLFVLELMFGKFLLPTLGSTPQVWIASMLFFQAALLGGYMYAHLLTRRVAPRTQAIAHVALVVIALIVLPVGVPSDARLPESGNPVLWQLGLMAITIGLPFFALASSAPLIQRWLAQSGHPRAADPYFLYRASNAGSVVGLVSYPLIIEPLLGLEAQGLWWTVGYVLLAMLMAFCAWTLWKAAEKTGPDPDFSGVPAGAAAAALRRADERTGSDPDFSPPPASGDPIDWRRRAKWLALAFAPSSMMLGATTYLTRDIAPVPLLWVLPLATYLASFVVAFSPRPQPRPLIKAARLAMPVLVVVLVYAIVTEAERPLWLLMLLHLATLFAVALVCHGALAADRPAADRLTEFYLWVSLGGALGGVFNALIAPALFVTLVEYPLAIAIAAALYPGALKERPTVLEFFTRSKRPSQVLDWIAPPLIGGAVAFALVAVQSDNGDTARTARAVVFGIALGIIVNFARRPLRFGAAVAAILLASSVGAAADIEVLDRDRSFFGIYRTDGVGPYHEIVVGTTVHGVERYDDSGKQPEPLSYYAPGGPVGDLFTKLPPSQFDSTAIVGLGAGGLACYSEPGAKWTFYEIDPTVARIARDPALFTYLRDCDGEFDVKIGDGRQVLADEPEGKFGLIVLDAFTSDAVPFHLITREALAMYEQRLRPGGVLLFNVSNRYVDLEPVLGNLAHDLGLACRTDEIKVTREQAEQRWDSSKWVVMARAPGALDPLGWKTCGREPDARTWTDDYSNVLGALRWG